MLMLIDVGGVGDSAPGDSGCAVVLLLYIPEFPIHSLITTVTHFVEKPTFWMHICSEKNKF